MVLPYLWPCCCGCQAGILPLVLLRMPGLAGGRGVGVGGRADIMDLKVLPGTGTRVGKQVRGNGDLTVLHPVASKINNNK